MEANTENTVNELEYIFLEGVLNKQFELVGCDLRTVDIVQMPKEEQTKLWNQYKFTEETFAEWKNFFFETVSKINPEADQELSNELFNMICEQWAFDVE